MVDPITTTIVTVAIKELGPPIFKETVKAHQKRLDEEIDTIKTCVKLLDAPEVVEKAIVGATIVKSVHPYVLAIRAAEGVIKGVDRYIKS